MNKYQANLGTIVVSPAAQISMREQGVEAASLLQQHMNVKWNKCMDSVLETDDFTPSRLMSAQKISLGELWLITEFDSNTTTISHPDELLF